MAQEIETKEVINESQTKVEKPTRKGLDRYMLIYRLAAYISALLAVVCGVFAFLELIKVTKMVPGLAVAQFALLFGIFSMVSRLYYKSFTKR